MRKCKIPKREENELRKWDEIVEKAPDKFHTFWWLKHVKMDYETYLTYTNSIYPISLLNIKKGWKVLDIGCGWGRDLNIIRKAYGADAIGIDIQIQNNDIIADGRFLCFKDNTFDAVIAITTLAFVREEEKMLKEIWRVLKNNGKLLLLLYNSSPSLFLRKILKISGAGIWTPDFYGGYRKFHNMNEITSLLKSLNFRIEIAYYTNFAVLLLNRFPKFVEWVFRNESRISKMWIARMIAKRIVVIARAEKKKDE